MIFPIQVLFHAAVNIDCIFETGVPCPRESGAEPGNGSARSRAGLAPSADTAKATTGRSGRRMMTHRMVRTIRMKMTQRKTEHQQQKQEAQHRKQKQEWRQQQPACCAAAATLLSLATAGQKKWSNFEKHTKAECVLSRQKQRSLHHDILRTYVS
jgi:hypothetical protein